MTTEIKIILTVVIVGLLFASAVITEIVLAKKAKQKDSGGGSSDSSGPSSNSDNSDNSTKPVVLSAAKMDCLGSVIDATIKGMQDNPFQAKLLKSLAMLGIDLCLKQNA